MLSLILEHGIDINGYDDLKRIPHNEEYAREKLNAQYIDQSKKDYFGVMSAFLALGADINLKDGKYKLNALLRATMANDVEMVQLVLNYGVDKEVVDLKGRTPLAIAIENHNEKLVFLLEDVFALMIS